MTEGAENVHHSHGYRSASRHLLANSLFSVKGVMSARSWTGGQLLQGLEVVVVHCLFHIASYKNSRALTSGE